jgi:hypothetical protein
MQVTYNYIDYKNSFMCFSQKSEICHLKNATPSIQSSRNPARHYETLNTD